MTLTISGETWFMANRDVRELTGFMAHHRISLIEDIPRQPVIWCLWWSYSRWYGLMMS
ncbi:MAG TPA: hypothetical protein IGS52_10830 [Oscillatoriaceae cyanobacterium M33_DOE_052]|nr:hypothetical protein [Oscillatoriaceae cyanobacterium M33_DOE_052]